MEIGTFEIVISILGGFIAGSINTLAGNGSAITLSILTEVLGLPGGMANGSNRVGVFAQGLTSNFAFIQNKKLDISKSKHIIILVCIGAVAGVLMAVRVSNEQFMFVFKVLITILFFVVLIKPKRWLVASNIEKDLSPFLYVPLFLGIGFYGGFIQMGMGVIFLAAMVLVARYNIIDANAVKAFVVFLYTIIVIGIFQIKGLIDWKLGSIIAIGQALGGYLTAQFASKYKNADIWAYRLLVVIMVFVILKTYNIISW